jgi:diamine N-acetyltransferase
VNQEASLFLKSISKDPGLMTFSVTTPGNAVLKPLAASQEQSLAAFFEALSPETRRFYSMTDGPGLAAAHCAAIARHDKLRLTLRDPAQVPILALVEFSLDVTPEDLERFAAHGVTLTPATTCRWGLCIADEWQGRGVGRALAPPSLEIASRFNREYVILWGGVHAANTKAVLYYRRVGFMEVGRFTNDVGIACIDMLRPVGTSMAP